MATSPLSAVTKSSTLCAYCPKMCKFACPISEAIPNETLTTWGKMSLVHLAERGDVSTADVDMHAALEACTGCGACVEQCAHGNPVAETLFFSRGAVKTERSTTTRKNFEETGDVKRRDLWSKLQPLKRDREASIAYFPGCQRLTSDDGRLSREQQALAIALDVDVPVVDLPSARVCCGYPLYAEGHMDALVEHLEGVVGAMLHHEIVVTPDPGCAYVLDVVRRQLGVRPNEGPRVVPVVEVLARHADRFKGASAGMRVRYHDPCYLARRGRTIDAPRALIEAVTGAPPAEFTACKDGADCSGGGGLFPMSNPEGARAVAQHRLRDPAAAMEPLPTVTACPSARKSLERGGAEAFDIVDLVLGLPNRSAS